jgi:hypothetical protein
MHGIKVTFLTNFLTGKPLRDSFLLFTSDIFPESYRDEQNRVRTVDVFDCGAGGLLDLVYVTGSKEVIAYDPVSKGFMYYTSETSELGASLTFHGGSHLMADKKELSEGAQIETHPCTQCHVNGGLVMKEIRAPWLNWQTDRNFPLNSQLLDLNDLITKSNSEVPSRPAKMSPAVRNVSESPQGLFTGQEMEKVTMQSQVLMNEIKISDILAGRPVRQSGRIRPEPLTVSELVRPLFCETETQMATALAPDVPVLNPDTQKEEALKTMELPLDLFINRLLIPTADKKTIEITRQQPIANAETLQIPGVAPFPLQSRLDMGSGPDNEDSRSFSTDRSRQFIPATMDLAAWKTFKSQKGFFVPISKTSTGRFHFLMPTRSFVDDDFISRAVAKGIFEEKFAAAVLMVDFANPVFSKARCGLLDLVDRETRITSFVSSGVFDAKKLTESVTASIKSASIPDNAGALKRGQTEYLKNIVGVDALAFMASRVIEFSTKCTAAKPDAEKTWNLLRARRARWFPVGADSRAQRFAVEDMVRERLVPAAADIRANPGSFFGAGKVDFEGPRVSDKTCLAE